MKLSFLRSSALILITVFSFSSCASIVSRTNYPVNIRTEPKKSTVIITDRKGREVFNGQSPVTVNLKSGAGYFQKAEYEVKISSPGYSEKIVNIYFQLNGWYFGNVIFGGFIGMLIVDPATGAMWRIVNPVINETPIPAGLNSSIPTLNILDVSNVSEEVKTKLIRIN